MGAQLAHCLAEGAMSVRVEGLGTFHRRERGPRGGGRGLLYLLAPEMRAALGLAAAAATDPREAAVSFRAWLADRIGDAEATAAVERLASDARLEIAAGRAFPIPGVGTLTRVTTVPIGLQEPDGSTRRLDPRLTVAFELADALKARL